MAEGCDLATTVHLSGGFGFVYSLHVASCTPRIGPWQAWNGKEAIDLTTRIVEK